MTGKRMIAMWIVLLMMIGAVGCTDLASDDPTISTAVTTTTGSEDNKTTGSDPTNSTTLSTEHQEATEASTTTTVPEPGDADVFQDILEQVSTIRVGTAGVTMVAVEKAVTMLEWCTETTMTDDEIRHAVQTYYDGLSENDQPLFSQQIALVADYCGFMREEARRKTELAAIGLDASDYDHWTDWAFDKADVIGGVIELQMF